MTVLDRVDAWLVEARRAYPDVAVDEVKYRAAITDDCTEGVDLYLAVACAAGDGVAARRFDAFLDKVPQWLKLSADDRAIADEVRQRVATRALVGTPPPIAAYTGRGPLWAWVRVIVIREHARLRRELGRVIAREAGDDGLDRLAESGVLSADLVALRRHRATVMEAFRAAVSALPAADRTLLRLAYVDELSLDAIGKMYGLNKSTISRKLAACRADILAGATTRLQAALEIPANDLESLLGIMPRDLDVSLQGLLRTSA